MAEYLRRILNIRYALNGVRVVLCEKNIRLFLAVWGMFSVSMVFSETDTVRMYFFYASFLLLIVCEMINSAVERLADFACRGERSAEIGLVKDISAGAVFLIGSASFLLWLSVWIW